MPLLDPRRGHYGPILLLAILACSPTVGMASPLALAASRPARQDDHMSGRESALAPPQSSSKGTGSSVQYGETPSTRTVYTVASLICMLMIAAMFGYRVKLVRLSNLKSLSLLRCLVFVLYFLAMCFIISASILETGLGLSTLSMCRGAIFLCLVFYVGSKIVLYVFLVERAHTVRAPYLRRIHDWVWVFGIILIAGGFGTVAVFAFIYPIADLSSVDGKCRIGLPSRITRPLLVFDIFINLALTAVFIYLLRPLLSVTPIPGESSVWRHGLQLGISLVFKSKELPADSIYAQSYNRNFLQSIERLLRKSLIGVVLVLIPTVANLAILFHFRGREQGWLCLTICTLDVTWAVGVIHWLTVDPEADGTQLVRVQPDYASSASTPRAMSSS